MLRYMGASKAIEDLQCLLDSGQFHHATYRCQGTVWEGLWIYCKDPNGFRGYSVYMSFPVSNKESCDLVHKMLAHTGISVGSYGNG